MHIDVLGNIISIKDSNGNDIVDKNNIALIHSDIEVIILMTKHNGIIQKIDTITQNGEDF